MCTCLNLVLELLFGFNDIHLLLINIPSSYQTEIASSVSMLCMLQESSANVFQVLTGFNLWIYV